MNGAAPARNDASCARGAGLAVGRSRCRVDAGELHEHLVTQFDAIRPRGCACSVPRPIRVSSVEAGAPNWWLGPVAACDRGCGPFLRWLYHRVSEAFELRD